MAGLLEKVVTIKLALGVADRYDALLDIQKSVDTSGMYGTAKLFGVLVDESAEDFAIEFMTAFNAEVYPAY